MQGNISYIALLRGQYKIYCPQTRAISRYCPGGWLQPAFDQTFDLPFDLQGTVMENFILYIVDLVTFTCGIEYFYFFEQSFFKLISNYQQ